MKHYGMRVVLPVHESHVMEGLKIKRTPNSARRLWAYCLPFFLGMASCMLLWSSSPLFAQPAVALRPSCCVYVAPVVSASAVHTVVRTAEPGWPNSFGDPWVDLTGTHEEALEEVEFFSPFELVYVAEGVEMFPAIVQGVDIRSGAGRFAPLYRLFGVYRI